MLDALGCRDQTGVTDRRIASRGDDLFAFPDEASHPLALLGHGAVESRDDVVEPLEVVAGLLEVMLEGLPQLVVGCRGRHLWKRID